MIAIRNVLSNRKLAQQYCAGARTSIGGGPACGRLRSI